MKEKRRIPRVLRTPEEESKTIEEVVFDDSATVTISVQEYNRLRTIENTTIGKLMKRTLGGYDPNFEFLLDKPDSFKQATELLAHQLVMNEHWKHLIANLKQDQVNNLINAEAGENLPYVRGSINGIFVVEDTIKQLAVSRASKKPPMET